MDRRLFAGSVLSAAVGLALGIALVLPAGTLQAQLPPLKPAHLNPMIEKLAAGKAVFGPIISDLSMSNARTTISHTTKMAIMTIQGRTCRTAFRRSR